MNETLTVEQMREMGKAYVMDPHATAEQKSEGGRLLMRAVDAKDAESCYWLGRLVLDGTVKVKEVDSVDHALKLICVSANRGYLPARTFLNGYCDKRYRTHMRLREWMRPYKGQLLDFNGKPIYVSCKGLETPVDAILTHEDDRAVLTLSANILFLGDERLRDPQRYRDAVLEGFKMWEGDYEVFGGQPLTVRMNLTYQPRLKDSVIVAAKTKEVVDLMMLLGNIHDCGRMLPTLRTTLASGRSFAFSGSKWSTTTRKFICLQEDESNLQNYEEIRHLAKHEFGHVLGLGDLYACASDDLEGVAPGVYDELDGYHITDRIYNLVMCEHHGPVSNNDVEMVILAFRDDRMQLYQPDQVRGAVSEALGKGN